MVLAIDWRDRKPYPELRALTFLMPPSEVRIFAESRRLLELAAAWTSEREVVVERGLGGRSEIRGLPAGGKGKAPKLVVLRSVLPSVGMADEGGVGEGEVPSPVCLEKSAVLSVGTAGVECVLDGFGVGRPETVTARVGGRGVCDVAPGGGTPESALGVDSV